MTTSDIMKRQLEAAHPINHDQLSAPVVCGRQRWDRIDVHAAVREYERGQESGK